MYPSLSLPASSVDRSKSVSTESDSSLIVILAKENSGAFSDASVCATLQVSSSKLNGSTRFDSDCSEMLTRGSSKSMFVESSTVSGGGAKLIVFSLGVGGSTVFFSSMGKVTGRFLAVLRLIRKVEFTK